MRDSVEGQQPLLLVQVNANPMGFGAWEGSLLAIVPEGEGCARPVKGPGVWIAAQPGAVIAACPVYLFVSHSHSHLHDRKLLLGLGISLFNCLLVQNEKSQWQQL